MQEKQQDFLTSCFRTVTNGTEASAKSATAVIIIITMKRNF